MEYAAEVFQFVPLHDEVPVGWERILEQERHEPVVSSSPQARVIVIEGEFPTWAQQYLTDGGVMIATGLRRLPWENIDRDLFTMTHFEWPGITSRIHAPTQARLARGLEGLGRVLLHEDRVPKAAGETDSGVVVSKHLVGRGTLLVCWLPLGELVEAMGDSLRTFAPDSGVTERVATVDKALVARVMVSILAEAANHAGVPYLRPRYAPVGERSVTIVRVDVDGVHGGKLDTIAKELDRHGIPGSFFLNGELSEKHPGSIGISPDRHQIGQHGYIHDVFASYGENRRNIRRGAEWLEREFGSRPDGFVAPRGLWNGALERALTSEGYSSSSDFGLQFDGLPFTTRGGILQVPVHPYSPERAARYRNEHGELLSLSDVTAHYRAVLDERTTDGSLAHIYGHPERLADVIVQIAAHVATLTEHGRTLPMTLAQYANWWQKRGEISLKIFAKEPSSRGTRFEVTGAENYDLDLLAPSPYTIHFGGHARPVSPAKHWQVLERNRDRSDDGISKELV